MLLELGAGYRPTPGFVHLDFNPGPDIEIVWDAADICACPEVGEGSCDAIRATHLLEHFSYRDTIKVLQEWYRALRPGGELYLEVPNFAWQTRAHANGEITDEAAVNYVFGEQDYAGNFHYAAFTPTLLANTLDDAGYVGARTQDIGQVILAWAWRPAS